MFLIILCIPGMFRLLSSRDFASSSVIGFVMSSSSWLMASIFSMHCHVCLGRYLSVLMCVAIWCTAPARWFLNAALVLRISCVFLMFSYTSLM